VTPGDVGLAGTTGVVAFGGMRVGRSGLGLGGTIRRFRKGLQELSSIGR
jgi:hypothetical protein